MNIIACIDDNYGMAFNHRRQTRDVVQRHHLNNKIKGHNLWMNEYSGKLYEPDLPDVSCYIEEEFLSLAGKEDFVLSELNDISEVMESVDSIYLYRWNRSYPEDLYFPKEVIDEFELSFKEEFAGSSHDEISFEIYKRK